MCEIINGWLKPALLALGLVGAAAPAAGQSLVLANERLEEMQRDYQGLRSEYQLAQSTGLSPAQISNFESRLAAFEQELRSLTGMLERLGYQQNQLAQRLDRMEADIEYRLTAIEGGTPATGGAATAPSPASPPATQSGAAPAPSGNQPQQLGSPPQMLGTVAPSEIAKVQNQAGQNPIVAAPSAGQTDGQTAALPSGTAEAQYDYARGLLLKADYAGAEAAFRTFLQQHPNDALAGNAKYWLGETYYARGNYQEAASAFGVAYQDHPNGTKAPDSLLKLGLSLSLMGKGSDACAVFKELEARYTTAPDYVLQRSRQERSHLGC